MDEMHVAGPSGISVRGFYPRTYTAAEAIREIEDNANSGLDESLSSEDELPQPNANQARPTVARAGRRGQGRARVNVYRGRVRRARGGRGGINRGRRQAFQHRYSIQHDIELGWADCEENDDLPNLPAFTAHSGITKNEINVESKPLDIFSLFFDENIFEKIKVETNKYADKRIENEISKNQVLKPKGLLATWKSVTVRELKLFFAIVIHMSLVIKPMIRLYWSTKSIYATKFCKSIGLSRDRFLGILAMLHMNDNRTDVPRGRPGHDALHKIRPIHDHLLEMSKTLYLPKKELTIDEGMCPFRGRLRFKVYIKGKPHKYGIKLNMICEASSGYCCNFEIYTGAQDNNDDYNTVCSLVNRLAEPYYHKGHTIYLDRFFSSPMLFDQLWNKQTMAVGTVMSNRQQMPKHAFEGPLRTGQVVFRRRNHLLATKWHDKRDVFILSTCHKAEMIHCMAVNNTVEKLKPSAVISYNKFKVGVDRSDQLLSYNCFRRKTIKWWKKIFFHLFDMAMINSQIVYNKSHQNTKINLLRFYEEIAYGLVTAAGIDIQQLPEIPNDPELMRLDKTKSHFIAHLPATPCKKKPYRRCKVCYEKAKINPNQKRVETQYMCEACQTPLCIIPCFKLYHTKNVYWE